MVIGEVIYKLRTTAGMSQEKFAEIFRVSRQAVQKWESGSSVPELSKIIEISKHFGISLDSLILDRDARTLETMQYNKEIKPEYSNLHIWERYVSDIMIEFQQSIDEGLDIAAQKDIFTAVSHLPDGEIKEQLGEIIFKMVCQAKMCDDYKYHEPSDLESIKYLRKSYKLSGKANKNTLEKQILGAWMGRVCGCMLGKGVEGIRTNEFKPFLKKTHNYPLSRYILRSDISEDDYKNYVFAFRGAMYVDEIDGMPIDDDTNYTVLYQLIIDQYGRDFTPYDVAKAWLHYQRKDAYCTAERVAFCNFVKGFEPPYSAQYKNPYREWIGAQIRGDYFGYINPGNPELAAEMAWRDASVSHIKNGIYGEMFVSAMIAAAAINDNFEDIIRAGLAQIPETSRLFEDVSSVIAMFISGKTQKECFSVIHKKYDEYTSHGWCHTIPNAMIVAAALLYGGGNYGKSICMAVETGFDTDCNGATVGSVIGMALGIDAIDDCWQKPMNDTLHTSIFGVGTVKISDLAKKTMAHIKS